MNRIFGNTNENTWKAEDLKDNKEVVPEKTTFRDANSHDVEEKASLSNILERSGRDIKQVFADLDQQDKEIMSEDLAEGKEIHIKEDKKLEKIESQDISGAEKTSEKDEVVFSEKEKELFKKKYVQAWKKSLKPLIFLGASVGLAIANTVYLLQLYLPKTQLSLVTSVLLKSISSILSVVEIAGLIASIVKLRSAFKIGTKAERAVAITNFIASAASTVCTVFSLVTKLFKTIDNTIPGAYKIALPILTITYGIFSMFDGIKSLHTAYIAGNKRDMGIAITRILSSSGQIVLGVLDVFPQVHAAALILGIVISIVDVSVLVGGVVQGTTNINDAGTMSKGLRKCVEFLSKAEKHLPPEDKDKKILPKEDEINVDSLSAEDIEDNKSEEEKIHDMAIKNINKKTAESLNIFFEKIAKILAFKNPKGIVSAKA